jgi:hypothetical protein
MKKLLLVASTLGFLLTAACAHRSAGYAAAGYAPAECSFSEDCYGYDRYPYSCVFYQVAPAVPARLQVVQGPRRSSPRTLPGRGDSTIGPEPVTGSSSSSASTPESLLQPVSAAREPVILVSPPAEGRIPHGRN